VTTPAAGQPGTAPAPTGAPSSAAGAAPGPGGAPVAPVAPVEYLLRLADNALVLSHRLAEWTGHGPVLEEDLALTNVALDLLGQARLLYQHCAAIEGKGATEDDYAYFRDTPAFRNLTALELPNSGVASAGAQSGDYAFTIARNFLYACWALPLWERLAGSRDAQLAAIAGKAVKETRYHLRHAADWLVRFGDGTEESHARAQAALDALMPYTNEWFADDALDARVAADGTGVASASLRDAWLALARPVVAEATLQWPAESAFRSTGKSGRHGEHLGYLLAEMQSLARAHPGATW
jgi:ring-1,2-phenylacetyl-CoA epoxidase subunit PaaC